MSIRDRVAEKSKKGDDIRDNQSSSSSDDLKKTVSIQSRITAKNKKGHSSSSSSEEDLKQTVSIQSRIIAKKTNGKSKL